MNSIKTLALMMCLVFVIEAAAVQRRTSRKSNMKVLKG